MKLLLTAAAGILILFSGAGEAQADQATVATITDGDTFRTTTGERIRIAGIDTPETQKGQAKCALEISRGKAAASTLRGLIGGQDVRLERVGKSYKRIVARVWRQDVNIGDAMIYLGNAEPWPKGSPKPDWCRERR